jgi:glutaredoxin
MFLIKDRSEVRSKPSHQGRVTIATACLFGGVAVLMLAMADEVGGLPFSMPRSWYTSRPVWIAIGLIGSVGGAVLLKVPRAEPTSWKPRHSGPRFGSVVLYTRVGCHLCDDAKNVLTRYASCLPVVEEVDIDADPMLVKRYGTCVPVVEIDGKVRFRGRVNEILLRRLIDRTPVHRT